MARNYLPECNIEMVTNGDPQNLKRLNKLFENGLNRILISAYDGKEDAQQLEDLCLSAKLNDFVVVIDDDFIILIHSLLSISLSTAK